MMDPSKMLIGALYSGVSSAFLASSVFLKNSAPKEGATPEPFDFKKFAQTIAIAAVTGAAAQAFGVTPDAVNGFATALVSLVAENVGKWIYRWFQAVKKVHESIAPPSNQV